MRKVKIFYGGYEEVEDEINAWLAANWSVSIEDILQSECPDSLTITVLYLGGEAE